MTHRSLPAFIPALLLAAAALASCAGQTAGNIGGESRGLSECGKKTYYSEKQRKPIEITDADGQMLAGLPEDILLALATPPRMQPADAAADAQLPNNAFDAFLDCYIGPANAGDVEQRLLRGHVTVAMLATYGAFNLRLRRYNGIEEDAATILARIEAAEIALSRSSRILLTAAGATLPAADPPNLLFLRVDRAVDVLQLAIDVERPTVSRVRDAVSNLVGAITGAPGAVSGLVKSALTGIKKAAVLELYGTALRNDAYIFLDEVKGRKPAANAPTAVKPDDWARWDRLLHEACAEIAGVARSTRVACVPSARALQELLDPGRVPSRSRS